MRVVPKGAINPEAIRRNMEYRIELGYMPPPRKPAEHFYDASIWSEATGLPKPPLQFALKKHKDLPDVPLVTELARTEEQREILDLLFSRQEMGRPFMLPPNTPGPIATVMRDVFAAAITDPVLLADAERQRLDINQPMTGVEVDALIAALYRTPQAVVDKAIRITDMSNFK